MRSLPPQTLLATALCGGVLLVASCDDEVQEHAPPAIEVPADAVVQIGPGEYLAEPVFIHAAEIERWVRTVSLLEPDETERSWRRKALANISLPVAVVRAVFPGESGAAYEEILALREHLVAGRELPEGAAPIEERTGHAFGHHLSVWGTVIDLERGQWSEVLPIAGGFVVARALTEPPPEGFRPDTPITVETLTVRFVPLEELQAITLDARAKLPVRSLDPPGWEGILPAFYEFE
ncbi:MAG: hypothetical protein O2816_04470 [Planctomycetota bacterium]|nr:hypothetical protein [Planctomycetota bacterium]